MATSVKYDNTEILNTTYIPRFVQHESAPEREIHLTPLSSSEGQVIVSTAYRSKRIILSGILTGATESALETAIDNFKELFSREAKNLDISWAGSTRRYVATCSRHSFDRDHFHLLFVPWSAEFVVPEGIGEATAETTIESGKTILDTGAELESKHTLIGTAKPKPRIVIVPSDNVATCLGVSIGNKSNQQRIVVPLTSLVKNVNIEVDTRLKKVSVGGSELSYYRQFPEFDIGENDFLIKIGFIIDQAFDDLDNHNSLVNISSGVIHSKVAQRFTVDDTDATYRRIEVYLAKTGTPAGNIAVSIVEDNGGLPTGSTVVTGNIAAGALGESYAWEPLNTAVFTLNSSKVYWLLLDASVVSDSVLVGAAGGASATYKRGNVMSYITLDSKWEANADMNLLFRTRYRGLPSSKNFDLKIYQYPRYL